MCATVNALAAVFLLKVVLSPDTARWLVVLLAAVPTLLFSYGIIRLTYDLESRDVVKALVIFVVVSELLGFLFRAVTST